MRWRVRSVTRARTVRGRIERIRRIRSHPAKVVCAREEGMTLIELLITLVILPLVIGGLAYGLVAVFSLQSSVSGRVTDSGNAQTLSATYLEDVEGAQALTTASTPICGTGTQLLGLEWGAGRSAYEDYVSYNAIENGTSSSYSLLRESCVAQPSANPTSSEVVATDLSAATVASSPVVTCSPLMSDCASQARTAMVATTYIAAVSLPVTETLSTNTGSSTPFSFTLTAAPRTYSDVAPRPAPALYSPFSLLSSTSCSALTLGNNAVLSINVGSGTDNGALGVASTCAGAVSVGPNAQLLATSVITPNTSLDAISAGSGATYPSSEYYTSQVADPFANLTPPADPPSGGSVVTCSDSGGVYTCPPGYYTSDPGLTFTNGATVHFTPGGTFWFEQGLTIANNVDATFATGTYIFDSTTSAISTAPGTTIDGTSGVLFYVHSGSATFGNNATINLKGLAQYDNIAIWDAAANGTSDPITLGNNGSSGSGYGGVYVPNGQAVLNNNGTVTCGFLVTSTASISNNVTLNITSP